MRRLEIFGAKKTLREARVGDIFVYHTGHLAIDKKSNKRLRFLSGAVFSLSTSHAFIAGSERTVVCSGFLQLYQKRAALVSGYDYFARVIESPSIHWDDINRAFNFRTDEFG